MTLFKLEDGKKPIELSEGMKVKFNLMLALSHRAEVLILDEPTSGLDPFSRDELLDVFTGLKRDGVVRSNIHFNFSHNIIFTIFVMFFNTIIIFFTSATL